MLVIALGPDARMCRIEANRAAVEVDPDGTNTTRLDGKSIRLAEAISMVGTPPFFGGGRVVIVDDLLSRHSKSNADFEQDEKSKKSDSELASLFEAIQPGNLLVLVEPSLATVPTGVKKQLPKDARVVAGEPPRGHALIQWMQELAESNGSKIERDAAHLLAEMTFPKTWSSKPSNPRYDRPPDLDLLSNEIAKLGLYAHPEPIQRGHVAELAEAGRSDKLFSFVENAVAGNIGGAVTDLESFDIHGDDAHRASSQLFQQIELSTVLANAPRNADPVNVGGELGLSNPQRMYGISKAPRAASPTDSVLDAVDIDRQVKTGRIRGIDDAIYALLSKLSEAKRLAIARRDRS